jgi:L-seryl-tRNA(Ser) seleniumtransferase
LILKAATLTVPASHHCLCYQYFSLSNFNYHLSVTKIIMKRRDIIKSLSALPFAGSILAGLVPSKKVQAASPPAKRDLLKELGVRTFINARGTITFMTGSLMHDYVLNAINNSSKDYCMLDELQDKVGERIAKMAHAEAATVTSGAFSAITLGMAGILTGMDLKKSRAPA